LLVSAGTRDLTFGGKTETLSAHGITTGSQSLSPAAAGGPTVLIVEPLPDQQWKLARMFTVQGYRVIGSASLHAAKALLRRFPVNLILLAEGSCEDGLEEALEGLMVQARKTRVLVMSDSKEAQQLAAKTAGVECVSRPSRMQDLLDFNAVA